LQQGRQSLVLSSSKLDIVLNVINKHDTIFLGTTLNGLVIIINLIQACWNKQSLAISWTKYK